MCQLHLKVSVTWHDYTAKLAGTPQKCQEQAIRAIIHAPQLLLLTYIIDMRGCVYAQLRVKPCPSTDLNHSAAVIITILTDLLRFSYLYYQVKDG